MSEQDILRRLGELERCNKENNNHYVDIKTTLVRIEEKVLQAIKLEEEVEILKNDLDKVKIKIALAMGSISTIIFIIEVLVPLFGDR